MVRIHACLIFVVWLVVPVDAFNPAKMLGSVSGIVEDEKGRALPSAKVAAEDLSGRPRAAAVPYAIADASGHFSIENLPWGKYGVLASKEESGYPNLQLAFYSDDKFPKVTLTPQNAQAWLVIRIGPKAAALSGVVSDSVTREPIAASFRLTRRDKQSDWILTSVPAKYRVLIPSNVDVIVEVSAPGHARWFYPGVQSDRQQKSIKLHSGQEFKLSVMLQPQQVRDKGN